MSNKFIKLKKLIGSDQVLTREVIHSTEINEKLAVLSQQSLKVFILRY
jgi:hypothetical protein